MLNFTVITIFPQMLSSPLGHSILKKAQENGLIKFDMLAAHTDPVALAIEHHDTYCLRALPQLRYLAPQQRLDSRDQFLR